MFLNCIVQFIDSSNLDRIFLLGLASILFLVQLFGMVIPGWAVSVRRLHDIGKSGWWVFIALIPVVGSLVLLVWSLQDSDPDKP